MLRKLIEEAMTAIFGTSNDDYFTSASKIPYFNNVSGQGFLPKGFASVSKFVSVLGVVFKYSGHFITSEFLPSGKLEDMRGNTTMRGLWGVSTTNLLPSDFPTGWKDGAVVNIDFYSDVSLQIAFNRQGGVQARFYWYGSWKDWG